MPAARDIQTRSETRKVTGGEVEATQAATKEARQEPTLDMTMES